MKRFWGYLWADVKVTRLLWIILVINLFLGWLESLLWLVGEAAS